MPFEIHPSPSEFRRLAASHNVIPMFAEVLADRITPVSLLASQWTKSRNCFLLESVEGGEKLARYSIVSFEPEAVLDSLDEVARRLHGANPAIIPGLPRFFGGAVGYLSYETVRDIEKIPITNPDHLKWPLARFFFTDDLFVFDNSQQVLKLITCIHVDKKTDLDRRYREGVRRLERQRALLKSAVLGKTPPLEKFRRNGASPVFASNVERAEFMAGVRRAKEHIGKGDIIQVVLSRRQERKTAASPLSIYRALRVVNPSPYMYLIKMADRAIIGSSPELLVRLEDGVAATRPIAGTRKRGKTANDDARLAKELLADPKERAEHTMLVDLGRNDLGRVCAPGSVAVPTFMAVERYSHVMHIVSEVTGRIDERKDSFDLLRAAFPAGTVAGAPKIRAMEIINDIEKSQRGPYAGALGYFSYSGAMDMAITIRTMLWERGRISFQTGAGIVADSDPGKEFEETENKAAAMKEAIRMAESGELFLEGR